MIILGDVPAVLYVMLIVVIKVEPAVQLTIVVITMSDQLARDGVPHRDSGQLDRYSARRCFNERVILLQCRFGRARRLHHQESPGHQSTSS